MKRKTASRVTVADWGLLLLVAACLSAFICSLFCFGYYNWKGASLDRWVGLLYWLSFPVGILFALYGAIRGSAMWVRCLCMVLGAAIIIVLLYVNRY